MYPILDNLDVNEENVWLKIFAPNIARSCKAGQFIILRTDERGERIPLTLSNWNEEEGSVEVIFQKVGASTHELGEYKKGDKLLDVVGPLGIPTHTEGAGNTIVIGGGLGIAIATPVARGYKKAGNQVDVIIGARNANLLFNEEEITSFADSLTVCTDDGSKGIHGFVTEPLKKAIESGKKIDTVFCVGPPIMMKFISNITREKNIKTMASVNSIMIDGTGMCGACRLTVGEETKFACVDGPDFDAHLIDWDEMMSRSTAYEEEEKEAMEYYHKCRAEAKLEAEQKKEVN